MEKVKLPREVAEAIEGVKEHADESLLYNVQYMHDVCENEKFDAPKFQPIYNWIQRYGHKEYFRAIVNGYEVEQTPEEKVKEYYKKLIKNAEERDEVKHSVNHHRIEMQGIINTLKLLNIKIEGVNE